MKKCISLLFVLILLFSMTSCASVTIKPPPRYNTYPYEILGPLGASEEDMTKSEIPGFVYDKYYKYMDTHMDLSFFGADFDCILRLGVSDCVAEITFHTFLEDRKAAAETIAAISAKSTQLYRHSLDWICRSITHPSEEHTAEELEELFVSSPPDCEGGPCRVSFTASKDIHLFLSSEQANNVIANAWGEGTVVILSAEAVYSESGVEITLNYHPHYPETYAP